MGCHGIYATIKLIGTAQRDHAGKLMEQAPDGYIGTIKEPTRPLEQNARPWAMLTDVSKAIPDGRRHTPDDWKAIFMNAAGWEVQFVDGLDGRPFPSGFRSSRMSGKQMADLITFVMAFGDEHGVAWSESETARGGG